MLMIPLPYLLAFIALYIAVHVILSDTDRKGWALAFLFVLAFQELLVGTRFGYGADWLREIQPFTASLLPPTAYLCFRRPVLSLKTALHFWPLVAVTVTVAVLPNALDAILALNNVVYGVLLALLGLRGADALAWAKFSQLRAITILLWLTVALLAFSGLTDAAISFDFWRSGGANIKSIAGWASALGLVFAGILFFTLRRRFDQKTKSQTKEDTDRHDKVFSKLEALMTNQNLFKDPDINLTRIARRLALPVRDVSRAINVKTGRNVSQYINELRINAACDLLKDPEKLVTQVIYEVGYNSKSNFNREFQRVTGKTPSAWRAGAG